eukprot:scaffold1160_cov174-Ochromonas_danica.AAC.42
MSSTNTFLHLVEASSSDFSLLPSSTFEKRVREIDEVSEDPRSSMPVKKSKKEENDKAIDLSEVDIRPRSLPTRSWRRKSLIPRIPKRDFRRDFPLMLANVSNSFDFKMYASFCRSTLFSSCCMIDYKTSPGGLMQPIYQLCGVESIIDFFVERYSSTPDTIFDMKCAQIKQYLYKGGSEITINAHIRGTRIREVLINVKDEKNRVHTVSCVAYAALLTGRGVISSMPLSEALSIISSPQCWADFKLDINPYEVNLRISFTYFLDNSNRIYKLEKRFF